MKPKRLFNVLSGFHPMSREFRSALEKRLIPMSLPKNYILLEAPKIATHAYFLDTGFAMSYSWHEGRKVAEGFWKAGEVMVVFDSFFEQKPSDLCIQLMKKSDLYCIGFAEVQEMLETFPEAQHIYRGVMNKHLSACLERLRDTQRLRASERHRKLLGRYPGIEQLVSQDAIASYLGITAQSLARMKRRGILVLA